jgi:hypothetical protein
MKAFLRDERGHFKFSTKEIVTFWAVVLIGSGAILYGIFRALKGLFSLIR